MNLTYNNFGLSGQVLDDYDYFLCGRKCQKRKKEKRRLRNERKELKNDERRAETERLRTETDLMQRGFEPSAPPPPPPMPTPQSIPAIVAERGIIPPQILVGPPIARNPASPAPEKVKPGLGTVPMILIGLVAVGGIVVLVSRKK